MKILHYNFAQPNDKHANAGGVGVYLNSLVPEMLSLGHEVTCMSSGLSYSPYSEEVDLHFGRSAAGYATVNVVNSPVVSPSYRNFFSLDVYQQSHTADILPSMLRKRFGEIDVFHFHNIEGLPLEFFYKLRSEFGRAAIFYSAHNYNLACPQVNLWKRDEKNCRDYDEGRACLSCIHYVDAGFFKRVQAYHWLKTDREKVKNRWRRKIATVPAMEDWRRFDPNQRVILRSNLHETFSAFRQSNIAMAEKVFDSILAVSLRTKHVLESHGFHPDNIDVSYIGSAHVSAGSDHPRKISFDRSLRIAYVGYARRDKGFYFLLHALRELPAALAARISLTIVAKVYEHEDTIFQAADLVRKFNDVKLINGYTAEELPQILADVDLGIVPPLWEDNLPQVAIEFAAYGVPFLASDLGGATEIANNRDFSFAAGSSSSFAEALWRILSGTVQLGDFWSDAINLRSPQQHVGELLTRYREVLALRSRDVLTDERVVCQVPS